MPGRAIFHPAEASALPTNGYAPSMEWCEAERAAAAVACGENPAPFLQEAVMFAVETISRSRPFRQIRIEETEGTGTYWCYMHAGAGLPRAGIRPCFTGGLLT